MFSELSNIRRPRLRYAVRELSLAVHLRARRGLKLITFIVGECLIGGPSEHYHGNDDGNAANSTFR